MMRKPRLAFLAGTVVLAGVAAFGYFRPTTPDPTIGVNLDCNSCDARQASKKRLRDYLQSLPED